MTGKRLETGTNADSNHRDRVDIREAWPGRAECLFERRIDDLQVGRCGQPLRYRGVVVHLQCVFVVEAEIEALAQEGNKIAAEMGSCKPQAEAIVGAARHHSFAADPRDKGVLDGVRVAVRGASRRSRPEPSSACSTAGRPSTSSALRLPTISPSFLGSNCARDNAMTLKFNELKTHYTSDPIELAAHWPAQTRAVAGATRCGMNLTRIAKRQICGFRTANRSAMV
jgi:hypothetical protein